MKFFRASRSSPSKWPFQAAAPPPAQSLCTCARARVRASVVSAGIIFRKSSVPRRGREHRQRFSGTLGGSLMLYRPSRPTGFGPLCPFLGSSDVVPAPRTPSPIDPVTSGSWLRIHFKFCHADDRDATSPGRLSDNATVLPADNFNASDTPLSGGAETVTAPRPARCYPLRHPTPAAARIDFYLRDGRIANGATPLGSLRLESSIRLGSFGFSCQTAAQSNLRKFREEWTTLYQG